MDFKQNIIFTVTCALCLCVTNLLLAQADTGFTLPSTNQFFKPIYNANTDISYLCPMGEFGSQDRYIFSTEFTSNFFIFEPPNKPYGVSISPTIRIRMFRNDFRNHSNSVRTPSYMVKARLFYALPSTMSEQRYIEMHYVHHSNGQDGSFLNPDGSVNTYNGSFGTNYSYLSYNKEKKGYKKQNVMRYGFEWHYPFIFHAPGLIQNYGFSRLHVEGIYKKNTNNDFLKPLERWRFQWKTSYAINKLKNYNFLQWQRRLNIDCAISFWPNTTLGKSGFYLGFGYYGEDPYNIYFDNRYPFVRAGFSMMLGR